MLSRMLPATVFLIFFGVVVSAATAADSGGKDRPQKADMREKLLKRFDANSNGRLDPDEKEAAKEAMARRREQGAGAGDPAAGGRGGKGKPDPERMKKLLARFDSNNDGKLDETERAAAKEARQKRQAKEAKGQ